jgi:small-conductance mechanosensitive channel
MLLSATWLLITASAQTVRNRSLRQLLSLSAWLYVAIVLLGISDNVGDLLNAVGLEIFGFRISLLLVVKVVVVLSFAFWASIVLSNFVERRIARSEGLTPGLRLLIGKILRVSLIVLAAIIALSGIGIDLTVLSVLSGAIGVGIGFGLQKVVSNFISGIIILADHSIRPGDTISVGQTFGWIRELRARFVSVVTRDGREYLIPNEDFITKEVINWSFSDELIRLDVNFGVSYDSDPHQVSALAIEAACNVNRVIETQQPVCWLTQFGDSSIDFVLRFWIRDPQNGLTNIRGQVLIALWDTFKHNDIKIPYPHREIIYKNSPPSLEKSND